jgi:hypothetical protein
MKTKTCISLEFNTESDGEDGEILATLDQYSKDGKLIAHKTVVLTLDFAEFVYQIRDQIMRQRPRVSQGAE